MRRFRASGFAGLNGVNIVNARNVKIINSDIGFFSRSGVFVAPANGTPLTKVAVIDSYLHDNTGPGLLSAPPGTSAARVSVRRSALDDNGSAWPPRGCGSTPRIRPSA